METPNQGRWSDLPIDILRSVLEHLSFVDFHHAKIVCQNWYLCSKQSVRPKITSPWLILSPDDGCVLYNPIEDKIYKPTKRDFSGIRFLASSGKWCLVVDHGLNLSIIDLFSDKKIDLPPLESIKGATYSLERVRDKGLMEKVFDSHPSGPRTSQELRGVLWVNEEDKQELEYVVVWRFDISYYVGFCKNGYDHHLGTTTRIGVRRELRGVDDMVLQRDMLYIFTKRSNIRILDLSGQDGFKDVTDDHTLSMDPPALIERETATKIISNSLNITVTTSGDVFLVHTFVYEDSTSTRHMIFRVYKRDPTRDWNYYDNLVEVDSLGDEAIFVDSGIMVPADKTLGIEPNSIYFTRNDRVCSKTGSWFDKRGCLDVCVYNLAAKTFKRFPGLSNLNIKDALWLFPS